MDYRVCKQVQPVARKMKKHGKDDFDRVRQAEKKKRRLERALATSAAIRAKLEKKKQKRLDEQQRLEERRGCKCRGCCSARSTGRRF